MTPHPRHHPGDDESPGDGDDDGDDDRDARRRRAAEALFLGSRNHGGRPKKDNDK